MPYRIRIASKEDVSRAHALHAAQAGEFLWPRKLDYFDLLVEERCVFVAEDIAADAAEIVGLCYLKADPDLPEAPTRWEFGGVYVLAAHRQKGLAGALGRVAVGVHFAAEPDDNPVVAHVHADNDDPRKLLESLGFRKTGTIEVPGAKVPPSMRRNAQGNVPGDEFDLERAVLEKYAEWFQSWKSKGDPPHIDIAVPIIAEDFAGFVSALVEIST